MKSEKKQPVDLGLLEEDDEFEEFPAEDWAALDEDEDAHVWEDNWNDDSVEDNFSNMLRAEQKNKIQSAAPLQGQSEIMAHQAPPLQVNEDAAAAALRGLIPLCDNALL
ncbi:26S proteasome complex subunit SEM1-like [Zootoca vivipara]|uniref:26S proteasome complex subunit SEM1-like n=1 Tax=Zootoca vivipara TaxID=8524 RepID=UPI00293BE2B5|nr:26S proteasome complex subunit SEM1-like [Zootoca vivipara]